MIDSQADPFTGQMRVLSKCCNQPIVSHGFMSDHWAGCSGCHKPINARRRMDEAINATLRMFPEVQWDRFSVDANDEQQLSVFGWIERPQDEYMDYIELTFDFDTVTSCSTSSARYSAEFSHRLGFDHNDCQRVEHRFKVPNMIRLASE